jgi:uncharacterized membrane protein
MMTKTEFLAALGEKLAAVSPEERDAAMQYYAEYLDEAGPEREAGVLGELGSPEKLAQEIIAASGAITANGWTPPPRQAWEGGGRPLPRPAEAPALIQWGSAGYSERNTRIAKILLLALGVILLISVLGSAGGVLLGVLAALAGVFVVPAALGAGLMIGGVSVVVAGVFLMGTSVGSGLIGIGAGILLTALGAFCLRGGVRLLGRVLPKALRGGIALFGALWNKLSGMVSHLAR